MSENDQPGSIFSMVMKIHTLRLPTPFKIGPVNVFLMVEDPITLVDTGPNMDETFQALRDQVEALGVRLERIARIVVTHAHADHAGLAARLKRLSDAVVLVHSWDAHQMTGLRDGTRTERMLGQLGVPRKLLDAFEEDRRRYRDFFEPLSDVHLIDEGDELTFDGASLRVLHTPGHTPGHICLWREGARTLMAADTVLKRVSPNPVLNADPRNTDRRFPSLRMYLNSLTRLRDLAPTVIYTGHGEQVSDLEAYCNRMRRQVRDRQLRLLELLPPQAVTAWEMCLKLFPEARQEDRFLAISEASAHLDFALSEGKLIPEERDGVEYYRLM